MEPCRVRDHLKEIRVACVSIGPGNGRVLSVGQIWNRLWKDESGIKIRILRAAAVAGPPTGVEGELGEICQP